MLFRSFAHAALRLPLTVIGPMQYIVPIVNFLLGWLVYGEDMQPERFAGFVLVWIGLACTFVDTLRNSDVRRGATPDDSATARVG